MGILGSIGQDIVVGLGLEGAESFQTKLASLRQNIVAFGREVADTSKEFARWKTVQEAFTPTLRQAQDAVGGLADDFALVRAQMRLTQAGLSVTDAQFRALAVGAVRLSRVEFTDVNTAMDRLTDSVISGREQGLRPLGIQLRSTGDAAADARQALEALGTTLGGQEESARGLGEQLTLLDNAWGDFKMSLLNFVMGGGANAAEDFFGGLTLAMRRLTAAMRGEDVDAMGRGLPTDVERLDRQITHLQTFFGSLANNANLSADSMASLSRQLEDVTDEINSLTSTGQETAIRGLRNRLGELSQMLGTGGRRVHIEEFEVGAPTAEQRSAFERAERQRSETAIRFMRERAALEATLRREIGADVLSWVDAQNKKELDQLRRHKEELEREEKRRFDKELDMLEAHKEALERQAKKLEEITSGPLNLLEGSFESFANTLGDSLKDVITGQKELGRALHDAMNESLLTLAGKSAGEAIWETAKGFAAVARAVGSYGADVGASAEAAAHFTSAAVFASIAGVSGGLAAATYSGTSAQIAQQAARDKEAEDARKEAERTGRGRLGGTREAGGSQWQLVFNINALQTSAEMRRIIFNAVQDAKRLDGLAA